MPHFRLETNLPKDKIPPNFLAELRRVVSKTLGQGKPEELCAVTIVPDQFIVHGTIDGPCGQATFSCIQKFRPEKNKIYSKALSDKIAELGIPADRMFIHFIDCKSFHIGFAGTTIEALGL